MTSRFETNDWHDAVARIISASQPQGCADALIDAIGTVVNHEGTCLIAFHRDARPEVVHHTLEPAGAKHYLDRYLAGPYLLDPLYQLALQKKKPSMCRFRDQLPDRFRSSEYYRQYCEQTHLLDEMDFLSSMDRRTTLALVVGRRSRRFRKAELRRLKLIEPTVQASISRIWSMWQDRRVYRGRRRWCASQIDGVLRPIRRSHFDAPGATDQSVAAARPFDEIDCQRTAHRPRHRDGSQAQPVCETRHKVPIRAVFPVY